MQEEIQRGSLRVWLMRLAAVLMVPLLFLGGLELMLRVGGVGHSAKYWKMMRVGETRTFFPNTHFSYLFFPKRLARTPLQERIDAKKPANVYRIFLFGGSAAYGDPDPAYGMGRFLEVLLRERFPGQRFDVVCTAMTAINSHAVLPIARESANKEGDAWILYMGNNEMVGAFGAGTIFSDRAPPLPMVRGSIALKRLRIGQVMDALGQTDPADTEAAQEWGGIDMFRKDLRAGDPAREVVYGNFRGNLEDILRKARKRKIPVILSTVATNLKDCAPFSSIKDPELGSDLLAQWRVHFESGLRLQDEGDWEGALKAFQRAEELDPGYAETHFRKGRCQLHLGDPASALSSFQKARDLDGLAVRADSRINEVIRDMADHSAEVRLLDAVKALRHPQEAVAGQELFYEHVHFTLQGNERMGRLLAEEIRAILPQEILELDKGEWPTSAFCYQQLALTLWDQHRIWNNMRLRLEGAPHDGQSTQAEQLEFIRRKQEEIIEMIDPQRTPLRDRRLYEEMVRRFPEDTLLLERHAQYLEAMGDRGGALDILERLVKLLPESEWAHYFFANLLLRANREEEAIEILNTALRIRPTFVQAREALQAAQDRL